jgi:PucR family transcriptional regulator, purine catabolism regulatory protein
MKQKSTSLTVEEILESPLLKKATVAAGEKGLNKTVTWVHILELTNCRDYLNGRELILTTGAGWKDKDDPLFFLNQLIEEEVTALCIQMGEKFNSFRTAEDIPSEMIEAADRNDFPLILFPEDYDCRYVDLMHSLHTMIINKNYKIFLEQEKFLNELYLVLINPHDTEDILHFLHEHLKAGIAYIPANGKPLFVPAATKAEQEAIAGCLESVNRDSVMIIQKGHLSLACRRVNAYQQELGCLVIYSNKHKLSSFDYLILEKSSVVLAQEFMGSLFFREKEKQSREQWVSRWLSGRMKKQEIQQQLQAAEPFLNPTGVAACLVQFKAPFPRHNVVTESMLNITGIVRTFLEQQGFFLIWQKEHRSWIYILVDTQKPQSWKLRLSKALAQINELFSTRETGIQEKEVSFYVGKNYKDLSKLKISLENAKEVRYIREKIDSSDVLYYDDLHVYRIILMLENNGGIQSYVDDYLEPLMDINRVPNKTMLNTLLALRDCQYNKKEAAEKLFIARQSLYQRIKTLEDLLGEDFITSPEKRICLEISLYGLEFLKHSK